MLNAGVFGFARGDGVGLEDSTHPTLVLTVGDGLEGRMSNYRRYRVAGGTYFTFGSAVARHSFGTFGAALLTVVHRDEKKVAPRRCESSVEPEHSQSKEGGVMQLLITSDLEVSRAVSLVERGVLRLGRGAECEVRLDDPTASRCHAELRVNDGRVWVKDAGSRFGT